MSSLLPQPTNNWSVEIVKNELILDESDHIVAYVRDENGRSIASWLLTPKQVEEIQKPGVNLYSYLIEKAIEITENNFSNF